MRVRPVAILVLAGLAGLAAPAQAVRGQREQPQVYDCEHRVEDGAGVTTGQIRVLLRQGARRGEIGYYALQWIGSSPSSGLELSAAIQGSRSPRQMTRAPQTYSIALAVDPQSTVEAEMRIAPSAPNSGRQPVIVRRAALRQFQVPRRGVSTTFLQADIDAPVLRAMVARAGAVDVILTRRVGNGGAAGPALANGRIGPEMLDAPRFGFARLWPALRRMADDPVSQCSLDDRIIVAGGEGDDGLRHGTSRTFAPANPDNEGVE